MPYTFNQGEKIHYHVEGSGPPLVLQHGGYGSLHDWYDYNYVSALKDDYRLILTDARAHGQSAKPHQPENYSPELHAGDVIAVLDELGLESCHFFGFSMGGRIGYWVALFHPARVRSLMVLGSNPYAWESTEIIKGAQTISDWPTQIPYITEAHRDRLVSNDVQALVASLDKPYPDNSEVLKQLTIPCLVLCGDADGGLEDARRSAADIDNAVFIPIEGCDHFESLVRSDLNLPHIRRFLADING
ncbi:MAG TPA: alpha/beta hydrolase [Anaerolineales bacterium]|nr:alpha/beta hydrolase [Anaerolineales bacterium]